MEDGFHLIDPFKTYKESFAHYVDIKEDDFGWGVHTELNVQIFNDPYYNRVPLISECQEARLYNFFNYRTYAGYSAMSYAKYRLHPN